jgi:uncharacterized protein (DUF2345 family)
VLGVGRVGDVLRARDDDTGATAYADAHLQLSTPSGIAALTPAAAIVHAGGTSAITAGQDLNFATQGGSYHSVKSGISLFTYGKAVSTAKPNQEAGIRLHAASGKVSAQSQAGATRLTADKAVTVASVTQTVRVAARDHILMTAQGAYIRLGDGNIEVHGPGKIEFKASMKEFTGPGGQAPVLPVFPQSGDVSIAEEFSNRVDVSNLFDPDEIAAGVAYKLTRGDGRIYEGSLDRHGRTQRIFGKDAEPVDVLVGDGDWAIDIAADGPGARCDCISHEHTNDE